MGITVAEELGFALAADARRMQRALEEWQGGHIALDQPMLRLHRLDALRVALARATLGGCDLLLMEQPDAALSDAEAASIEQMIRAWTKRHAAITLITSHRPVESSR